MNQGQPVLSTSVLRSQTSSPPADLNLQSVTHHRSGRSTLRSRSPSCIEKPGPLGILGQYCQLCLKLPSLPVERLQGEPPSPIETEGKMREALKVLKRDLGEAERCRVWMQGFPGWQSKCGYALQSRIHFAIRKGCTEYRHS